MNVPMIVAEVSGEHKGSFDRAVKLVISAADAGADAVKFQCFTPEQMVDDSAVVQAGPWAGMNALVLYRETHTPRNWFPSLFNLAREMKMTPFASAFHPDDVDFLETLNCPIYKIASFEITDLALIRHARMTGKPLIISTGMATDREISNASLAAQPGEFTLLKCTSAYPAPIEDANLATLEDMTNWTDSVGLSDHTLGHTAAVVATALGATMIEKHLTLSRADGGPDAAFSAEPHEFRNMVKAVREAAKALGTVHYGPTDAEQSSLQLRRQSGGKRGES